MNTKRFVLSFALLNAVIFLSGCNDKIKSEDWIVCNLNVLESSTGEPIVADIQIYRCPPSPSGGSELVYSGQTDLNGHAYIEQSIKSDDFDLGVIYRIFIRRKGAGFYTVPTYYSGFTSTPFVRSLPLSIKEQNSFDVYMEPFYSFTLSAKNVNCTSSTDSVWIDWSYYNREAYGCADTLLPGLFPSGEMEWYNFPGSGNVQFNITTKKSGVVNSYVESYNLVLGTTPTPIVIEY